MSTTAPSAHAHEGDHDHGHGVPLWGLFIALLALTAGEVLLFEVWHRTQEHDATGAITWQLMPKYAMVLLLLVFTLPKAAIVMIYFMHLKFEKQFVVLLALLPFLLALIAVIPTLVDIQTLKGHKQTYNVVPESQLKDFKIEHGGKGASHGTATGHDTTDHEATPEVVAPEAAPEAAPAAAPVSEDAAGH